MDVMSLPVKVNDEIPAIVRGAGFGSLAPEYAEG